MPLGIYDTLEPKGDFPVAKAKDIEMPDGGRVSDISAGVYPVLEGVEELQPEKFYNFGETAGLSLTLAEVDDGKAHEYCFEFIPLEGFTGLTISPEVSWTTPCAFVTGKIHQVSILRGVGVMIRA